MRDRKSDTGWCLALTTLTTVIGGGIGLGLAYLIILGDTVASDANEVVSETWKQYGAPIGAAVGGFLGTCLGGIYWGNGMSQSAQRHTREPVNEFALEVERKQPNNPIPLAPQETIVQDMPPAAQISTEETKPAPKTMHQRYLDAGGIEEDIPSELLDTVYNELLENPEIINTGITLSQNTVNDILLKGNGCCPVKRIKITAHIHNTALEIAVRNFVEAKEKEFKSKKSAESSTVILKTGTSAPIIAAANLGINLFPVATSRETGEGAIIDSSVTLPAPPSPKNT